MVGKSIQDAVEQQIVDYDASALSRLVSLHGAYVIKFVSSQWAKTYMTPQKLKISARPALTWGTATYVTPLAFPLSSALYGRIGLVCQYDPNGWRVFDATNTAAQTAYIRWARAQPAYQDLLLTVHSTHANHLMRDKFRKDFRIDCVLFHPDQEAEYHTDASNHLWMAVTDWTPDRKIASSFSDRFKDARFSVLIDEDFQLLDDGGLPIRKADRQIENVTMVMHGRIPISPIAISTARGSTSFPADIANAYNSGGYLHVYVEP